MTWASRCRALRRVLGLSQAQFARLLSGRGEQALSVRTIQEWEAGRREPPGWVQRLIQREAARGEPRGKK